MSLDVALKMASCYEAVTQEASEMQADNVNKIDAKSATRNSKMAADHVTLLTTGNPPKRKKRENVGNAEMRDTYLKMNVAQQRKGGVGSVVTSDTLLKFAGARTTTRQKSPVWKIMKAWMTKSLQLSSPLKTSRK